jgi:hypothetical protein
MQQAPQYAQHSKLQIGCGGPAAIELSTSALIVLIAALAELEQVLKLRKCCQRPQMDCCIVLVRLVRPPTDVACMRYCIARRVPIQFAD